MTRIHIATTLRLGDDGQFLTVSDRFYETDFVPMRADRKAQQQAGSNVTAANTAAGTAQSEAGTERGTLLPMLQREATGTQGLTPTQRNQYMVSSQEALGGTNAGLTGEANLATARTRNAGGFASALDEAARQKARAAATTTQNVNNISTQLAQERQRQALQQLQGLYGTDTSAGLQAMGLSNQALNEELAAGRQGWLQNAEGVLNTLQGGATAAAGVKKAFA